MTDTPIPQMFWAALDAEPACMTLRCAVADWLEENGDPDGAECLRWTIAKNRTPTHRGWHEYTDGTGQVPVELVTIFVPLDWVLTGYLYAFQRLVYRWKSATPQQRDAFWKWEAGWG